MIEEKIYIEKYRPKVLNDIVGNKEIIEMIKGMIQKKDMPHILLCGTPGTGKTTLALCIAKEMFENNYKQNFLELNASDERGIDVIREQVKTFAMSASVIGSFKIILLDEADALTKDAQTSLRRLMEVYSKTCRFIFTCNYENKIIDPIKSRCVKYNLKKLQKEDLGILFDRIITKEKIVCDETTKQMILEQSNGDARYILNKLQTIALSGISQENLSDSKDYLNILVEVKNSNFILARKNLDKSLERMSDRELLNVLHDSILKIESITDEKKRKLICEIAETDFRIISGAIPILQLDAMLMNMIKIVKEG